MAKEESTLPLNALLALGVVFFVSMFLSCQELRYSIWGEVTTGRVESIAESHGRRGRHNGFNVHYEYAQPSTSQNVRGVTKVDDEEAINYEPGMEVQVEVIDGEHPQSRLEGSSHMVFVWIFLGSLVGCVGLIIYMYLSDKASNKPAKPSTARRVR